MSHRFPTGIIPILATAALLWLIAPSAARSQRVPPHLRPGRVLGTVTQAESGAPAVGATVVLRGTVLSATVLSDGTFEILDVPSGVYEVAITGRLYQTVVLQDVQLLPRDSVVLDVALRRHPLMGEQRVVTPAKRPQPAYEVAQSLSIVESDRAVFAAGGELARVLALVPGVHLNGRQLSIRAASAGTLPFGSRVALMVDGLPLISADHGAPVLGAVPLIAVDRIEVARGTSSLHYGSGAVAGAVNLITRRPLQLDDASARAFTGVYTDAGDAAPKWWGDAPQRFHGAEATWMRRDGRSSFLLSAGVHGDDGYRQRDARAGLNVFGRFGLLFDRGAELRIAAIASSEHRGAIDYWRDADSALFSPLDSGEATLSSSYSGLALEYRGVDSKTLAFQFRGIAQHGSNELDAPDSAVGSSGTRLGAELQFTTFLNRRVALNYGANGGFEIATPSHRDSDASVRRTAGAWGQVEFTNLYDVVATLGTRVEVVSFQDAPTPNELQITPHVGVAYHPLPSTSLRLTVGRGYRSPSFAERGLVTSVHGAQVVPNLELRTEQSWQGEVSGGYREVFGDAKVEAELALFVNEYFSMIEPALDGGGERLVFLNSGRARVLGVELQGGIGYRGVVRLEFAIAALSARDLSRSAPLPGRPSLLATTTLIWRPEPVTARLLYRYAGRTASVDAGTLLLVPDVARRSASHALDLIVDADLKEATSFPVVGYLAVRNALGSLATDAVGAVAPIRSVEAGLRVEL